MERLTKYQIVERLAKEKKVEEIISKITKGSKEDTLHDLANDIYLDLLTKPELKIQQLYYGKGQDNPDYTNNQLDYFITRIILNSVNSKTSRYYYIYKKFLNNDTQPLKDYDDTTDED